MRVVIVLGGNVLQRRARPPTLAHPRHNLTLAAKAEALRLMGRFAGASHARGMTGAV